MKKLLMGFEKFHIYIFPTSIYNSNTYVFHLINHHEPSFTVWDCFPLKISSTDTHLRFFKLKVNQTVTTNGE